MRLVTLLTIFAISLIHFAFWSDVVVLSDNSLFLIVDIFLCLGTVVGAIVAWESRNENGPDKWKYLMAICFAAATVVWCGIWSSDHRSKLSEHIKGETVIVQKTMNV